MPSLFRSEAQDAQQGHGQLGNGIAIACATVWVGAAALWGRIACRLGRIKSWTARARPRARGKTHLLGGPFGILASTACVRRAPARDESVLTAAIEHPGRTHDCSRCMHARFRDSPDLRGLLQCKASTDPGEVLRALEHFRQRGRRDVPFLVVGRRAGGQAAAWPLLFHPSVVAVCEGYAPLEPRA